MEGIATTADKKRGIRWVKELVVGALEDISLLWWEVPCYTVPYASFEGSE